MITADELRRVPLFATLPDSEAVALATRLADVRLREGDWLIHEGEQPAFFLLLDGELEVRKRVHGSDRRIAVYRTGEYFGELPLLLSSSAMASIRALAPARVAQLEQGDFHDLFAQCETFATELSRTMTQRFARLRQVALDTTPALATILGHRYDVACHRLRDFLARNHIAYRWIDPTRPNPLSSVPPPQPGDRFPVVVTAEGARLVTPTLRELAQALGLDTAPRRAHYDVAIVGAGPAGLAAAVYGASEGLSTVLFEREAPGGQAGTSSRIENYLGFPTGVSGDDLGARALQQARRFGAELIVARDVVGLRPGADGAPHVLDLDDGGEVRAAAVIVASGVSWRELEVPGADAMIGRGVYYGAARTEALECSGQHVFLVGGGNSAGQGAVFFASYARKVTLLVRGRSLADTMSHYLIGQLAAKANVEIRTRARIVGVEGDHRLEAIVVEDRESGALTREETPAVFVFIGADAKTGWLPAELTCDERGFVCTGRDVMDQIALGRSRWPLARDPYLLETSVPGIFAVGDVRHGSVKRVASSVGEGSMAIAFVHQYLAARHAPAASTGTLQ
jgi:thioredoxin reductase (NADPH)